MDAGFFAQLSVILFIYICKAGGFDYGKVDEVINLDDSGKIIIQSKNFPDRCCQAYNYQINYIGSERQHIRLEFTDIDIPLGSQIVLLDTNDELLIDQPGIVDKTYIRKGFAFNGSSIKVIFKPINDNKFTEFYSGFRAIVRATHKLPSQWDFWPTSEGCGPVNDVMTGGVLEVHSRPSVYKNGIRQLPNVPLHDCIWVFKLPPEFKDSGHAMSLFLRIDEMILSAKLKPNFELIIREDNSEGALLAQYSESSRQITNTSVAEVVISSKNLYVRFKLPYTSKGPEEDHYVLRISYGIFVSTYSLDRECKFGPLDGFNCINPKWCVPSSYKCDDVINCLNGEDESEQTCAVRKSDSTTVSTTPAIVRGHVDKSGSYCSEFYCNRLHKCFASMDEYVAGCTAEGPKLGLALSPGSATARTTTEKIYKVDKNVLGKCADDGAIFCYLKDQCFHFSDYREKCNTPDPNVGAASSNLDCNYYELYCSKTRKCVSTLEYPEKCSDDPNVGAATSSDCTWSEVYCSSTRKCLPSHEYSQKCPERRNCLSWQQECPDKSCISTFRNCKDTSCGTNKQKCSDGRCIYDWEDCSQKCKSYEKQCNDDTCVYRSSGRCKEDPCPSHKPFECDGGDVCVYSSYKCDGTCDCDDCTDEGEDICKEANMFIRLLRIICVPFIILLEIGCLLGWGIYLRKKADSKLANAMFIWVSSIFFTPLLVLLVIGCVLAWVIYFRKKVGFKLANPLFSGLLRFLIVPFLILLGSGFVLACIVYLRKRQNTGQDTSPMTTAVLIILGVAFMVCCSMCTFLCILLKRCKPVPQNSSSPTVIMVSILVTVAIVIIFSTLCLCRACKTQRTSNNNNAIVTGGAIAGGFILLLMIIVLCKSCHKEKPDTYDLVEEKEGSSKLGFLALVGIGVVIFIIICACSRKKGEKKEGSPLLVFLGCCLVIGVGFLVIVYACIKKKNRAGSRRKLVYILILIPAVVIVSSVVVSKMTKKTDRSANNGLETATSANNTNAYTTTYTSGTAMHPVVTVGAPPTGGRSHIQYNLVPTQPVQPSRPSVPDPSAPPEYREALDTTMYPPTQPAVPQQDELPPPPSYESVAASQNPSAPMLS